MSVSSGDDDDERDERADRRGSRRATSPSVSSASISSETAIVPSSAENAAPERPRDDDRRHERAELAGHRQRRPGRRRRCRRRTAGAARSPGTRVTMPTRNVIMTTIGNAVRAGALHDARDVAPVDVRRTAERRERRRRGGSRGSRAAALSAVGDQPATSRADLLERARPGAAAACSDAADALGGVVELVEPRDLVMRTDDAYVAPPRRARARSLQQDGHRAAVHRARRRRGRCRRACGLRPRARGRGRAGSGWRRWKRPGQPDGEPAPVELRCV